MDLRQLALKQQAVCQAFLDGEMDDKTFRGEMMTLAFTASGVSDAETTGTHRNSGCLQKCSGFKARHCRCP